MFSPSPAISELLDMLGTKQDASPVLTSLSGLTGGTNKMVYMTSATGLAICDLSLAGRNFLGATDVASQRSGMGLATVAATGAYADLSGLPTIPGITLTTTGTSGNATLSSGILNVPNYTYTLPNTGTAGSYSDVTTDAQGRIAAGTTRAFNLAPARSIVSVAASANGFQIDAARDAWVTYSVTISGSSSLSGGASGSVVLEVCSTNSATAANWTEIARSTNGQTAALIVGLTVSLVAAGTVAGVVPGGYYARLRSIVATGSPTFAYNSGEEVKA